MTRYWYHPESECYFTTPDDDLSPFDQDCSELTREEYRKGLERQVYEDDPF